MYITDHALPITHHALPITHSEHMESRTLAVNLKKFSTSDSFIYREVQMYLTYDTERDTTTKCVK
jgi:chaperone required for assembly of F1-ATPase